jgi:SAM-dependent MidA family methyltransferase
LLDNLPFAVARWDGERWQEVLVGTDDADGGRFVELLVPAREEDDAALRARVHGIDIAPDARLPIARGIDDWFRRCGEMLRDGRCCVIDYAATTAELLTRGDGWLRTYAGHGRGLSPLEAVGEQDITADVAIESLLQAALAGGWRLIEQQSQADWLAALGIDELVEAGRRKWRDGAAAGDLEALAGRSVVSEAAALTDRAGLGAHRVFLLYKGH